MHLIECKLNKMSLWGRVSAIRKTTQQTHITIMKNHDSSCFRLQWHFLCTCSGHLKTSFTSAVISKDVFPQSRERHVAKWCRCLLQALNWVSLLFWSLLKVRAKFRTAQNTEIGQFNEIQQLAYRKWVQLASTLGPDHTVGFSFCNFI